MSSTKGMFVNRQRNGVYGSLPGRHMVSREVNGPRFVNVDCLHHNVLLSVISTISHEALFKIYPSLSP